MSLSDLASIGSFVSGIAVVITLIFLLLQIRQNTRALQRAEANATQSQASNFRLAIINNREVAAMMAAATAPDGALDKVDELRFSTMMSEIVWFSYHIWDRQRLGLLPAVLEWERSAPLIINLFVTTRGAQWWSGNRASFPPTFGRDIDKAMGVSPT
jgi:hypothetical protein